MLLLKPLLLKQTKKITPKLFWASLSTTLVFLNGCGQNPAILKDSSLNTPHENTNTALSNRASEASNPTLDTITLLSGAGNHTWISDGSGEGFSPKDQLSHLPFDNKPATPDDDHGARPIGFAPYSTENNTPYSKKSNHYFRILVHLPKRQEIKKILQATLELKVRKFGKRSNQDKIALNVGQELLCLIEANSCSGKTDPTLHPIDQAFFTNHTITNDLFSRIELTQHIADLNENNSAASLHTSNSSIDDSELVKIPIENLFDIQNLTEFFYTKTTPTNDPSLRKLRFVMGNNTMATHAKLTLRFEMISPTTQDQKLADSVDQNTGNGLDSDDLPSFTPKEKIKLVDRIKVEEKIIEKEKIVYVDRIKVEEKIVEKEKIVYKNAPTPTPEPKKIIKIQLDDRLVHFQTNSSKLTADSQSKIEALAAILKTTRFERLLITGHTDVTGLLSYNIQLSKRRAQSVKNILSKMGLSPKKMLVDGKGPFEPLTSEMTSQGLAKNRRVELHLSGVQENDLPELKSMIEKIWPQTLDQNSTSK